MRGNLLTGMSQYSGIKSDMLSTATTLKTNLMASPKKKFIEPPKMGQFLFVDSSCGQPVIIKNQKVKTLYDEVQSGPFNTSCGKCNNRNLDFYDKLDQDTALDILTYIRNLRMKNKGKSLNLS
jgi:hypothetical protein